MEPKRRNLLTAVIVILAILVIVVAAWWIASPGAEMPQEPADAADVTSTVE